MKICWLCSYNFKLLEKYLGNKRIIKSHPSSWIVNLANELARKTDIELYIISYYPDIKNSISFKYNDINFHIIKYGIPFTRRGFPYYLPLDVILKYPNLKRKIINIVNSINPDIIHIHGTESVYGLIEFNNKYPTIVSIQGLLNLYNTIYHNLFSKYSAINELQIIKNNKYFGSRTEWVNKFLLKNNPLAKIYYLPEAINDIYFKNKVKETNNNLIFVGSLEQRKGVEKAIEIFSFVKKSFNDSKLYIIGDGNLEYVNYLKKLVIDLELENNVYFLGYLSPDKISEYYNKSTILIFPTEIDNSPNVVCEAMASGVIVIASNVGGLASLIEDKLNGFLFEKNDIKGMGECAVNILSDLNNYILINENAKSVANERHLPSKVAEITLEAYKEIIDFEN